MNVRSIKIAHRVGVQTSVTPDGDLKLTFPGDFALSTLKAEVDRLYAEREHPIPDIDTMFCVLRQDYGAPIPWAIVGEYTTYEAAEEALATYAERKLSLLRDAPFSHAYKIEKHHRAVRRG